MPGYASQVTSIPDVLSLFTRQLVEHKVWDQFFNAAPFVQFLKKHTKPLKGGTYIQKQFNIGKSPNGAFYTGAGGWSMVPITNAAIGLGWNPILYHNGIVVEGVDIETNEDSPEQIVPLIQYELDNARMSSVEDLAYAFMNNNPYSTTGLNPDGNASNPVGPEGLCVLIDDGTISANVGAQSRTTYPLLSAQVNYNVGALSTLSPIQTLWTSANRGSRDKVNLCLTSELNFNTIWGLFQVNEKYQIDPRSYDQIGVEAAGSNNLAINGAPIIYDTRVASGVKSPKTGVGSGGLFYGLNMATFELFVNQNRNLTEGPFYKDPNSDAYWMDLYWYGALTNNAPNRSFAAWISGG